ncbi:MAG: YcgN family cysteine cluster protein [Pseudomonadota bacterium]
MSATSNKYWEDKPLSAMTQSEWESLCDGCARCCMLKLQDEDTDQVHYTAAVCHLLDLANTRCTRYPDRHRLVEDCVVLDVNGAREFSWLPTTCAYRMLAEGRPLAWWHPLNSGDPESVHQAGISVRGRVVSNEGVHDEELEEMIVHWVEQ